MPMKNTFINLIKNIDVDALEIDYYPKKYLTHLIKNINYYIAIYDDAIINCIKKANKKIQQTIVIDYGCGNGILGLYAKYLGVKEIYLIDVSKPFLDAAIKLANALNIKIDSVILGDIEELQNIEFKNSADIIIGIDVVEHIYDVEIFLKKISAINKSTITCFTTGCNPNNWLKVKQLQKLQNKDEYLGGTKEDELLYGADACIPFIQMRKNIITDNFTNLSIKEVTILAQLTRGKRAADIILEIQKYKDTKIYPQLLKHKTNTCNPYTGSWTERIVELSVYKKMYNKNGFNINVVNGYYNGLNNSKLKNTLLKFVNICMATFPFLGKRLAPFIFIYGQKKD